MTVFRPSIQSQKMIHRRRDNFFIFVLIIFGSIFVFLILISSTAFIPWFVVDKIEIQGNRIISGEILDKAVYRELNQRIFWFVPKRSIFLIGTHGMARNILKEFPKLSEVKIDRSGFKSLRVIVSERNFTGLWCLGDVVDCFLVDEEGIAYEKFPQGVSTADLLVLKNSNSPKILERFIELPVYVEVLRSVSFLAGISFNVAEFNFISSNEYIFILKDGGKIMLGDNFYFELINKLPLLLKEYDWKTGGDFEYVDLRFPNKAFVK